MVLREYTIITRKKGYDIMHLFTLIERTRVVLLFLTIQPFFPVNSNRTLLLKRV